MLVSELKEFLKDLPNTTNVLIYVSKEKRDRQLVIDDIDKDKNGNIVIDAEYEATIKTTVITEQTYKNLGWRR